MSGAVESGGCRRIHVRNKGLGRWLVSLTPQPTWVEGRTGSCKFICKVFICILNEIICFFTLFYSLINLVFDDEEESKLTYTEIHQEYKELVSIFPTDFCFVLFEMGGVSLCSLAWPGTHYVNQSGLDLAEIYVSLPPQCWD